MRYKDDSELHLLAKLKVVISVANSICPSYREKPRLKFDFHITPIKVNLSENKIIYLMNFIQRASVPTNRELLLLKKPKQNNKIKIDDTHFNVDVNMKSLYQIKNGFALNVCSRNGSARPSKRGAMSPILFQLRQNPSLDISQTSLELLEYFPSDGSDDDVESCLRVVKVALDAPGFDENVSRHNMIKTLLRFCVDEVSITISRLIRSDGQTDKSYSEDNTEKPYLMFRLSHLVMETAVMTYGSATQITLKSLHLVDKMHTSNTGEYMELISTPQDTCLVSVLYRDVDPLCPDFASHYHSVKSSLIFNVSAINLVWHRSSIIDMVNFYSILSDECHIDVGYSMQAEIQKWYNSYCFESMDSSLMPEGSKKWSFAFHINAINLKVCDNEMDFMEAKIAGLEFKSLCKANDRHICQFGLIHMIVDDLSDITLHSRIVDVEEDIVFDLKYDELSPSAKNLPSQNGTVGKPDAYFDLRIGKIQVVFLWKFISDLEQFIDPVITKDKAAALLKTPADQLANLIDQKLLQKKVMLHFDIQIPNLLIPQKSDSPCLLLLNLGSIKIENMFPNSAVEDILVEFSSFQVNRAILTLGGNLDIQESILQPSKISCDIKRTRDSHIKDRSQWDINVQLGTIRVNLGQRDLNTIIAVLTQNRAEAQFSNVPETCTLISPVYNPSDVDDEATEKLEAFFHTPDLSKIVTMSVTVDHSVFTFYKDMDEVLSSPLRDAATAVLRIDIGELQLRGFLTSTQDLELKMTVDSCDIFDVRPDSDNVVKKFFGQYVDKDDMNFRSVYVSSPHLFSAALNSNQNGDKFLQITLEKTRFNVSANFLLSVYKCVNEAIPSPYESTYPVRGRAEMSGESVSVHIVDDNRREDSCDNTSGYLSSVGSKVEERKVTSVAIQIKTPEIMILAEPEKYDSQVLVLNLDINLDYSKHPSYESLKVNLQDVSITKAIYTVNPQTPCQVLEKCDFVYSMDSDKNAGKEVDLFVNKLCVHFDPSIISIIHCITREFEEVFETPKTIQLYLPSADLEDLWTPKKILHRQFLRPPAEMGRKTVVPVRRMQKMKITVLNIDIYLDDMKDGICESVLKLSGSLSSELKDLTGNDSESKHEIELSLSYFNDEVLAFQPVLEPISDENYEQRYFGCTIQTLLQPSQEIGTAKKRHRVVNEGKDASKSPSFRRSSFSAFSQQIYSGSSSDSDRECDSEMLILKSQREHPKRSNRTCTRRSNLDISSFKYQEDSDVEDSVLGNISGAFSHLFLSDSEVEEISASRNGAGEEDENSTSADSDTDGDFIEEHEPNSEILDQRLREMNELFMKESRTRDKIALDDIDRNKLDENTDEKALTVFVSSSDPLEFTLSNNMLKKTIDLITKITAIPDANLSPSCFSKADFTGSKCEIKLNNEIGKDFVVSLLKTSEVRNLHY